MTLQDIGIAVNERGMVSVDAPPRFRALAALLETDLRIEGPQLYTVLARLYQRDLDRWEVVGNSCHLVVEQGHATVVNNFTGDRSEIDAADLLTLLEGLRDELAFARARRRGHGLQ